MNVQFARKTESKNSKFSEKVRDIEKKTKQIPVGSFALLVIEIEFSPSQVQIVLDVLHVVWSSTWEGETQKVLISPSFDAELASKSVQGNGLDLVLLLMYFPVSLEET